MTINSNLLKLMAGNRKVSIVPLPDGSFRLRSKPGMSKEQLANDPRFARTKENTRTFAKAGKCTKMIRQAFSGMIATPDARMTGRLTQVMLRCLKADTVNPRGEQKLCDGDLAFFSGFEFNKARTMNKALIAPFEAIIDRADGHVRVQLPPFAPTYAIDAKGRPTHFRLIAAAAAIDFDTETSNTGTESTDYLPIDGNLTPQITLTATFPPDLMLPVFVLLRIELHYKVNGTCYPVQRGAADAARIIKVFPGAGHAGEGTDSKKQ